MRSTRMDKRNGVAFARYNPNSVNFHRIDKKLNEMIHYS